MSTSDPDLRKPLADLREALNELGSPAMIIGGVAAIARGVRRLTLDIDATVWGPDATLRRIFEVLQRHHIVPRIEDAHEFAQHRQVLLLVHQPTQTSLDISVAWLPFEEEALREATPVDFGGGIVVPVARAEDLIVYKFVAWRTRDKDDIDNLLMLHSRSIDLDRVRRLVQDLAAVLGVPQRVEEFEAIVSRALGKER